MKQYSYLALGDSYTIGEQVRLTESFPYQTVQLLRKALSSLSASKISSAVEAPSAVANPDGGLSKAIDTTNTTADGADSRRQGWPELFFMPPEIIAGTGFTAGELNAAIDNVALLPKYDFVSLLIGVNNQYRGRPVEEFATEFENLLQRAIQFAGGSNQCVYVLSIPDWGVTPFATASDANKIAAEIDTYNSVCEMVAAKYQTPFINITSSQRTDGGGDEFLAADKLHPSGKEYAKWAALLSEKILSCLS